MSLYDVVLFLHLLVLLAAFLLSGALHAAEYQSAGAASVQELRFVTRVNRLAPGFGVVVLLLLALGMWLVELSKDRNDVFDLGDGFVWTAMVVLVVLFLDGPLVLARRDKALQGALEGAGDGPVPAPVRDLAVHPGTWRITHLNTGMVLGVVLNMATKPTAVVCVVDVVVGGLLGMAVATVAAGRLRRSA